MKTDQKVAQPVPSPQAGEIVFPVEQAGPEEKATEGGGEGDARTSSSTAGLALFAPPALPSLPVVQATRPPASACSRPLVPGTWAGCEGETAPAPPPATPVPLLFSRVAEPFCREGLPGYHVLSLTSKELVLEKLATSLMLSFFVSSPA